MTNEELEQYFKNLNSNQEPTPSDESSKITQDALASPVRPEWQQFLKEEQANPHQGLMGFIKGSPTSNANRRLNELDANALREEANALRERNQAEQLLARPQYLDPSVLAKAKATLMVPSNSPAQEEYGPPLPSKIPASIPAPSKLNRSPASTPIQEVLNNIVPPAKAGEPSSIGSSSEDKELEEAQYNRALMKMMAGIGRSGVQIGDAIAGVKTPTPTRGMDDLDKAGELQVTDLAERRKAADDRITRDSNKFKLEETKKLSIPTSAENVAFQDMIGKTMPFMKDSGSLKSITLANAGPFTSLADNFMKSEAYKEANSQRREDKQERDQTRFDVKKAENLQKASQRYFLDLEKNKELSKLRDNEVNSGTITDLIAQAKNGNQTAFSALGIKVAKGMGEVGALTEADVNRYVTGGSLSRKAADTLNKWSKGVPSNATLEDIQAISNVINLRYQERIQPIYNRYAKSLANSSGISTEEAYTQMGLDTPVKKETKDSYTAAQESGIKAFMKTENILDRNHAIKILDKAGRL